MAKFDTTIISGNLIGNANSGIAARGGSGFNNAAYLTTVGNYQWLFPESCHN